MGTYVIEQIVRVSVHRNADADATINHRTLHSVAAALRNIITDANGSYATAVLGADGLANSCTIEYATRAVTDAGTISDDDPISGGTFRPDPTDDRRAFATHTDGG